MRQSTLVARPRSRDAFRDALHSALKQNKDSASSLLRAISRFNKNDYGLLSCWITGISTPKKDRSFRLLKAIELHYRLPTGHFKSILRTPSPREQYLKSIYSFEKTLLDWHLPDDFDSRSDFERREIIEWIRVSIRKGSTDYGKFLTRINRHRYSVLFPKILTARRHRPKLRRNSKYLIGENIIAPDRLNAEMMDLVECQTLALAPLNFRRNLVWRPSTMATTVRIFGHLFGALAASKSSAISGRGVPASHLTFGLFIFPAVLDWFFRWRQARRGFFSVAERNLLYSVAALTRKEHGWIRQKPALAESLMVIEGLVSARDIAIAKQDWDLACDKALSFAQSRSKEFCQIARQHRDPFEAILPILKAESPLLEYKKIVDEIGRDLVERDFPSGIVRGETLRAYLMVRIALHLGVRQRNLRELLICKKGSKPRTTNKLQVLRRGEMRWDDAECKWEVFIPAAAFKNARSTFFKGRPFYLALPNIAGLYKYIDEYLEEWRSALLKGNPDPGTFFVRTAVRKTASVEYDVSSFYDEWRWIIQRYGIYNPYTKRGAVEGLLPHGPHCIRDVLATHILRKTGSYELAGFAIQDTPASVMEHYARFLPEEKSARAAVILNEVWKQPSERKARLRISPSPRYLAR